MTNVMFSPEGWADYVYWQAKDKKTLKRINQLLQSILREGVSQGIGKPEPLKYNGQWSRRVDEKNRLVYYQDCETVVVTSCIGHYNA